jgi:hypothetical protein
MERLYGSDTIQPAITVDREPGMKFKVVVRTEYYGLGQGELEEIRADFGRQYKQDILSGKLYVFLSLHHASRIAY